MMANDTATTAAPGPASDAVDDAALLADLVDVLLPGDAAWPSARTVGVQWPLALRLLDQRGPAGLAELLAALRQAGAPLAPLDEAARVAAVERFEAAEPELFGWVRDAAYIAYYENPFVAATITASGQPYELRPHRKGYPLARFDVERQAPRHGRGHYVPTNAVRRVDLAGLDLDSERTQAWGLQR